MARTTISIPDRLLKRLKLLSAQRGVSMSDWICEAIEEKAEESRPRLRILGIADSGHSDTGRLAGEVRPEPRSWR
jgi:metal-responsive CopG/Arc/MetJ family transcriptional regulator